MADKNRPLHILKYLWDHTDEEHPAIITDILAHLESCGIHTNRKTVASDLVDLQDSGFDIVCNKSRQNQYFIGSRTLELAELKMIVDAVQAAKFISESKSVALIEKISALASPHQAEQLKRRLYVEGKAKTTNEAVNYTVDLGETVFDDDYIPIYNMNEKRYELIFVERGTIILDASLLRCRTQGRLRFTAAHELAHWLIHQELYSGTGDTAAMAKSISKSSDADKYIERQADMLGSALLLPMCQVKKAFYRLSGDDRVLQLATQFGVSKQAMEIRLRNHHLI